MSEQAPIHIGTSGWHYDHWQERFYPDDLARDDWLEYYASQFHTVEINNTFYHLPEKATLAAWRDTVPPGFIFAVKASRYITHMKKLKDPGDSVPSLLDRIDTLGDRVGPVLFQLPPRWHFNRDRLASFLDALPGNRRYAFEFRDSNWFDPQAYDLLAAHNAAFCIYDLEGVTSPKEVTADFVYVRLHGPDGAYQGSYDTRALAGWAGAFSTWAGQGKTIYCYFDNDQAGYAAQNALQLQDMIGG